MDFRDHSILTQVAFKGAIDVIKDEIDLTDDKGQAYFEQVFSYLTHSLRAGVDAEGFFEQHQQETAQVLQGAFPGSSSLKIKGQQYGPIPEWAVEGAAAKGITEVYDNRDRAQGTKRPWFKSTAADGAGIWPPDSYKS